MHKCDKCDKSFNTVSQLSGHKRIHSKNFNMVEHGKILSVLFIERNKNKYYENPKICMNCKCIIKYEDRGDSNKKFCSQRCAAINSNKSRIGISYKIEKFKKSKCVRCDSEIDIKINNSHKKAQCKACSIKFNKKPSDYKSYRIKNCTCKKCGKNIYKNKTGFCKKCWISSEEFKVSCLSPKRYNKEYYWNKWMKCNVYLLSGLEKKYVQYLDSQNIAWIVPKPLTYIKDGKEHLYFCDFYILSTSEYIEVKGYMWNDDSIKMELVRDQYPNIKLKILKKKDINELR